MSLSGNMLSDKAISDLFHRASVAFKCPVTLDLSHNKAGAETIKSITAASEAWPSLSMPFAISPPPYIVKTPSHGMAGTKSCDLSHDIAGAENVATQLRARTVIPMPPDPPPPPPQIAQKGNFDLSHNIAGAENAATTLGARTSIPQPPHPPSPHPQVAQSGNLDLSHGAENVGTALGARTAIPMPPGPPPPPPQVAQCGNLDLSHGAENVGTALGARMAIPMPKGPPPPPPQVAQKGNLDLSHNIAGTENVGTALGARMVIPIPPGPPPAPPQVAQKDAGNDQLTLERTLRRFPFHLRLNLSHNDLQVSGMQALKEGMRLISSFGNLKSLHLNGSLTSDADFNAAWLTAFLETYCCHQLSFLDISQNNLSVPGASVIGRLINSTSEHYTQSASKMFARKMNLSDTKLGDEGLFAFIDSFTKLCNLPELVLTSNNIHAVGISGLADATGHNGNIKNLPKINLSKNPLGLEGAIATGGLISCSRCQLKELVLSRCQLTTIFNEGIDTNPQSCDGKVTIEAVMIQDAALKLCQMAPSRNIMSLILSGNCFTGVRIHILAGLIRLCPRLNYLATSDCRITTEDLTCLLDELTKNMKSTSPQLCSNIERWNLTSNEIDNSGASALVSCVPSLFPRLKKIEHLILHNNPIISDSTTARLKARPRSQPPVATPEVKQENGKTLISYKLDGRHTILQLPSTKQIKEEEGDHAKPPAAKSLAGKPLATIPGLAVHDLAEVQNKMWEGRAKWYNIGLALKLTPGTLDAIERTKHHVVEDCFTATLKGWLSTPQLHHSWSDLATALRDKTVGLEELAEQLPT